MISVLLCCRNESHAIRDAVAAVESQVGDVEEPVEIVIACNRSTDGTEDVVRSLPHTRVLLDDNYHSGVTHNLGLEHCHGEIVLFLDGHMVLGPGSLAAVRRALDDRRLTGLCGYKWIDPRRAHLVDRIRDLEYHAKSGKPPLRGLTTVTLAHAHTMTGGLFAVRRDALLEAGAYDPTFRRNACEDIFVELRLLNRGHQLAYDPAVRAQHVHVHASVGEFIWRGYASSPRGLAFLLQRCAEMRLRVPFDGYVLQVPVPTTGLLLLGIAAQAVGWRYGTPVLAAGLAAQLIELLPFLTTRPGSYAPGTRLAAAAFWLLTNLGRLGFCAALLVRRFAPATHTETITGWIERPGSEPERIERHVTWRAPRVGPIELRLRLAGVLLGLWASMARRGWRAARRLAGAAADRTPAAVGNAG